MPVPASLFITLLILTLALVCPASVLAATQVTRSVVTVPNTELSTADKALKAAYRAHLKDDLIGLTSAARQVPEEHLLSSYLGYWSLRLQLRATDTPTASLDHAVRNFIDRNPRALPADLLRRQWMLTLARRGSWAEMLSHLPQWRRRNDTRVWCRAGQARLMLKRSPGQDALQAWQRDRDLGEDCGQFADALLAAGLIDTDVLRKRLWLALEVRDWKSVRLLAEKLGSRPERITQSIKRSVAVLKRYKSGNDAQTQASAPHLRDELLIALVSHSRLKPVDAAEWMAKVGHQLEPQEQRFVWSQIAASAMRDMIPNAYGYARLARKSPARDVTRKWLARAALRQQDWPLVSEFIAEMESSTQSRPTWVYWRARAMRAQGEVAGANALLRRIATRDGFYGALAAEELGMPVSLPSYRPAPPSARELARVGKLAGLDRAKKFYDLGLRYQGNREWALQLRGLDDRLLLATAHSACATGMPERCLATAIRTRHKHDWLLRYMTPYRAALEPLALERGLDPAWLYGLINQESRFALKARSSVGARGLMQIMPATGRWIAGRLGVKRFKTRHLEDFGTNVRFGTFYLKTVYESLNNSALLASAAYNAGPKRPRRWQSSLPATVDGALFAEIIPFAQTRQYVKKVLLNTAYYGSVFEGKPQSLKELLGTVPSLPFETVSIP